MESEKIVKNHCAFFRIDCNTRGSHYLTHCEHTKVTFVNDAVLIRYITIFRHKPFRHSLISHHWEPVTHVTRQRLTPITRTTCLDNTRRAISRGHGRGATPTAMGLSEQSNGWVTVVPPTWQRRYWWTTDGETKSWWDGNAVKLADATNRLHYEWSDDRTRWAL